MIITRISGGLGNQMFQYAIAKAIAKKNNDVFKLDLSFYPKQTLRKYELDLLNIDEHIASEDECIKLRGKENLVFKVKNRLGLTINRPKSYILESSLTLFDFVIYNREGNIYLDGFWQNEEYFKSIRKDILKDFTLKDVIEEEVKKYLESIQNSNSVSLHVRRGDYIDNSYTNNVHGVCSLRYYKKAIEHIIQKIEKPIFYIFSDDIAWCKDNFDFLESKVFVDNTKSALDDLELMKHCKHNIIANSTFSWWGAWLGKNSDKIVVAPQVWFVEDGWKDLTIAKKEWIKI